MGDVAHTIFFFALALGVLITIHEFGHFWVARTLGVKVICFSIGFGKKLWSYQKNSDSTEFILAAVPLGGYVKMVDEREGEVTAADLPHAFNRQSLSVRTAVVLAGPVFNLLLAVLLYWIVFCAGEIGIRPILGPVDSSTLAAQSGFKEGDEILKIAGQDTPTWNVAMSRLLIVILEQGDIKIDVRSEDEQTTTRILSVPSRIRDKPALLREKLGFTPWEPVLPPKIDSVQNGGPAAKAGLLKGDLVLSSDGVKIETWSHWVEYVRGHPDVDLNIIIERGGVNLPLVLHPEAIASGEKNVGRIGASVTVPPDLYQRTRVEYRLGFVEAFGAAVSRTVDFSVLTLKMVGRMLVGRASVENLSGPVSIAQYAGQSASVGFIQFCKFLALVSISLGVLNLLPIPVLDGGHLFFFLIEAIKGSPVSEHAQLIGQQVGIALLVSLMGLAFFLDIERLLA